MSEILNGLWNGILGLDGQNTSDANSIDGKYIVKIINNPSDIIAAGYDPNQFDMDTDTTYKQQCSNYGGGGEIKCSIEINILLTIYCSSCFAGNFTAPSLTELGDLLDFLNNTLNNTNNTININNVSLNDFVSIDGSLIAIPELPSISLPFDISFPNIDLTFFTFVTLSLDTLLLIYRWYRTSAIMARIIRGKSVKVHLHYLKIKKNKIQCPCQCKCNNGPKISFVKIFDMCLQCIIYCDNKIEYCGYNLMKIFYLFQIILYLFILILIVLACYVIIDQVITVEFIEKLGIFSILTSGIAAQRTVRNQVISVTAVGYNKFTLNTMLSSMQTYAFEKNMQAFAYNNNELYKVTQFNEQFCNSYGSYLNTERDVQLDTGINSIIILNFTGNTSDPLNNPNYLFDDNSNSKYRPSLNDNLNNKNVLMIELPPIKFGLNLAKSNENRWSWWVLTKINLSFEIQFNTSNLNNKLNFTLYGSNDSLNNMEIISLDKNTIDPTYIQLQLTDIITITGDSINKEYRYLKIIWDNVNEWINYNAYLKNMKFIGKVNKNKFDCPQIIFDEWNFNASNTYVKGCSAGLTPIHGLMYRGFIRLKLNDEMRDGHAPFIIAGRSICLSPFTIILAALIILLIAHLFIFIIEYILMKYNLYRQNPYAKVPLIISHTNYTNYTKYPKSHNYDIHS